MEQKSCWKEFFVQFYNHLKFQSRFTVDVRHFTQFSYPAVLLEQLNYKTVP